MTFPSGAGGTNSGSYGLSNNGSIPAMTGLTQGAVTDTLATEATSGGVQLRQAAADTINSGLERLGRR